MYLLKDLVFVLIVVVDVLVFVLVDELNFGLGH